MNKLTAILAGILAAIAAIISVFFIGKRSGRDVAESKQIKESLKDGLEIKKDIDKMYYASSSDIDNQLRKDARG